MIQTGRRTAILLWQSIDNDIVIKSLDGVVPSSTDAGRILESIFETELRGGPNKEARTHAKELI